MRVTSFHPLCRSFAAHPRATLLPAAVCRLGWCSLLRGTYKANTTLTVLQLWANSVGDAGAVALAEALKATVVTCGHEFREDALVWCSLVKHKELMRVFSCFSCCFLCLKGTGHQDVWYRGVARVYLVNVALCNDLLLESSTDNAWDPDFFCKNHKPLWCRDVLWIVMWCCLMFTEKAEVQKSVLSLAMGGFALVWAMGRGVGLGR